MNNVQLLEMSKKNSPKIKRGTFKIILHDDNKNTFDDVIDSLMDVCGHGYFQAVQCAIITHQSKQCSVLNDNYETCIKISQELVKLGLKVSVEKCSGSQK